MCQQYRNYPPLSASGIVSIIVPVYNAEPYIRRCLDSLLAQTFTGFEAILVDDGSPDRCGEICDEYAAKDSRFKVIHQVNGGVAVARQTGTEAAQGEYIIHCDPDDWVAPTWLEDLYRKAQETDADVTICDFYTAKDQERTLWVQRPASLEPVGVLRQLFHRLHGSLCNKLVKRACYTKYDLYFTPGINYCEDVLIWVQLLQHSEVKVAYLHKALYYYNQDNEGSITHAFTDKFVNLVKAYHHRLQELLPAGMQEIVDHLQKDFEFAKWKYGMIPTSELRHNSFGLTEVFSSTLRKRDKVRYCLAYLGLGAAVRYLSKIKEYSKRSKLQKLPPPIDRQAYLHRTIDICTLSAQHSSINLKNVA